MKLSIFILALVAQITAVPVGFTTYFNLDKCPDGFREVPESKGRVIVSVTDDSIAGLTVGEPLTNGEDRQHSHAVVGTTTLNTQSLAADGCCNEQGALHGDYRTTGTGISNSSNLPFTQLLLCAATNTSAFVVPFGTVSYFAPDTPGCPANWTDFEESKGRTIVPGYESGTIPSDSKPLTNREDRIHGHSFGATYTTDDVSYAGIDGCCNNDPAKSATYGITGEAASSSTGVPYIQLLTCLSKEETFDIKLPHGALIFSPTVGCPDGWELARTLSGRLLVALPYDGEIGFSFGGPSIHEDGTQPGHQHEVSGTLNLPPASVGLASGCCAGGYAKAGAVPFHGQSSQDASLFPFLLVPLCQRSDTKGGVVSI